jgi:UDP-N-acetylglucosamine:LPS N-acetylglucosamine transferase
MIKMPKSIQFLEFFVHKLNSFFIKKYDECWIPDFENEENLSGDLSHKYKLPKNAKFIAPQSRFVLPEEKPEEKEKLLVLLSGPEPHRTFLENQIIEQTKNIEIPTLIVRGLPHETQEMKQIHKNVFAISHFNSKILMREILTSKYIICRAGYSTIMDLHTLQKKAIIIPTPQQTEQEYLAEYLHKTGKFVAVKQGDLKLVDFIK